METKKILTNKSLTIDYSEWKKNITSKRYDYYDFNKEIVDQIAQKNIKDVTFADTSILAQALFPQYLLCSGLFDNFILFEVEDGVRVDPPIYCYRNLRSYLNNDNIVKVNRLAFEIEDLFIKNKIVYSDSWREYFDGLRDEGEVNKS